MGETVAQFMDRQRRRLASYGRDAEAIAHEAYRKAVRTGEDLKLRSPGEVMRLGAQLVEEGERRVNEAVSGTVRRVRNQTEQLKRRVNESPAAKSVATKTARGAGNVVGIANGATHAIQGMAEGAIFAGRLANPIARFTSPGRSATDQLGQVVVNVGTTTADYVKKAIADPGAVGRDINRQADQWLRELDPSATQPASTLEGELQRNFEIGRNQGEFAFDVGSLLFGGPAATTMKGVSRGANLGNSAKYLAQGFSPKAAAHLAAPYPKSNMGSHFIPRRTRLPEFLGGGPLPQSYMDGPFNKLLPPDISRGDFYELHYEVDPRFYGTSVLGERWSGRDLELTRHGSLGQLWYGSPAPLKARIGGLGASIGGGLYDLGEEQGW